MVSFVLRPPPPVKVSAMAASFGPYCAEASLLAFAPAVAPRSFSKAEQTATLAADRATAGVNIEQKDSLSVLWIWVWCKYVFGRLNCTNVLLLVVEPRGHRMRVQLLQLQTYVPRMAYLHTWVES